MSVLSVKCRVLNKPQSHDIVPCAIVSVDTYGARRISPTQALTTLRCSCPSKFVSCVVSVHICVHTEAPNVPVPWHYCILRVISMYQWKHAFFSTGKDASSCVVHLINDGVVVNGYDVSIQFLGNRNVRTYLCKLDDGNFYSCERNRYEELRNIHKLNTVPINC